MLRNLLHGSVADVAGAEPRVEAPARRVTDDGMDNTQGKPMTEVREFQDKRRLSEIASGARKKLREFADLPSFDQGVQLRANVPPLCWCFPADRKVITVIRKLGFIFGVGAHVMATKFDVDDDGIISSDELDRFRDVGSQDGSTVYRNVTGKPTECR